MPEDQCADRIHRCAQMCVVRDQASDPMHVQVALNIVQVEMLLDTGASSFPDQPSGLIRCFNSTRWLLLYKTPFQLKTYTGQPISVLGMLPVQAK